MTEASTSTFEINYSRWNGRLLTLLGMGPRASRVVLHPETVEVAMGWAFSATIPRSSIRSVHADDDRVWGWGVHGWRGRWLVNGSSDGLVRIEIDPPVAARTAFIKIRLHTLRVGVVERDALLTALA